MHTFVQLFQIWYHLVFQFIPFISFWKLNKSKQSLIKWKKIAVSKEKILGGGKKFFFNASPTLQGKSEVAPLTPKNLGTGNIGVIKKSQEWQPPTPHLSSPKVCPCPEAYSYNFLLHLIEVHPLQQRTCCLSGWILENSQRVATVYL